MWRTEMVVLCHMLSRERLRWVCSSLIDTTLVYLRSVVSNIEELEVPRPPAVDQK